MTYQQFIYEVMTGVKKNVEENITVNLNTVIKKQWKRKEGAYSMRKRSEHFSDYLFRGILS